MKSIGNRSVCRLRDRMPRSYLQSPQSYHEQCLSVLQDRHRWSFQSMWSFRSIRTILLRSVQESAENRIILHAEEPAIIARILLFIYHGIYESEDIAQGMAEEIPRFKNVIDRYAKAVENCRRDSKLAVKLYAAGERFGLPGPFKDTIRLNFFKAIWADA